jgi:hypothetical protein
MITLKTNDGWEITVYNTDELEENSIAIKKEYAKIVLYNKEKNIAKKCYVLAEDLIANENLIKIIYEKAKKEAE